MMKALFVFLFMFAASVSAQAGNVFDTGNELLSTCDNSARHIVCVATVSGFSDMLEFDG